MRVQGTYKHTHTNTHEEGTISVSSLTFIYCGFVNRTDLRKTRANNNNDSNSSSTEAKKRVGKNVKTACIAINTQCKKERKKEREKESARESKSERESASYGRIDSVIQLKAKVWGTNTKALIIILLLV